MDVFVYGTLQNKHLMEAVAGGAVTDTTPATLSDYAVLKLTGDVVPKIVPSKGDQASGVIYAQLSTDQIARLDLFEGAFGYARVEKLVETTNGTKAVDVYLPPANETHTGTPWDLATWEQDHLQPMLYAAEELFSHDPLPRTDRLNRIWPVIDKRAWAKHRATLDGAQPATLRYDASPKDYDVHQTHPPLGNFFRLQSFSVSHRTFHDTKSDVLDREVFMGVDAALILPYDPATDSVLLVEQCRMGPLRRGDPNPWQLEPIAGMTDARETPEQAARREAKEEAGIDVDQLDEMFAMYPSPGSSTDYFKCYCTPCTLPKESGYLGGLSTEAEDLRMHIIPLSKALDLIDTGEINAGPLVAMLYWLDRNKHRYHSDA